MRLKWISIFLLATVASCATEKPKDQTEDQPNIVLIMCDDMGYSDLGCYGGEISTPNIDALASEGIRFNNFKNTGRCCPSRAALMTGKLQHSVEMGWMTAVDEHRDGYRGQITDKIPTVAEILKTGGYTTYMSGKWHLTLDGGWRKGQGPNGSWPTERGFDQFYGSLAGGGGYRDVEGLKRNTEPLVTDPKTYYYTDAITENAVKFIDQHDSSNPLFLYLAHYAPHRPLQAPEDRIEACKDRYRVGYDILRERRYENLKKMGLIKSDLELPIYHSEYKGEKKPSWDSLSDKKKEAWITEMATFAAMVEIVDDGIGEVVEATKKRGIYDNTIFLFISDNGATSEGGEISQLGAALNNTPYRYYKKYTYMGGTSSPFIVHYPKALSTHNGEVITDMTHITDILPTCLDFAGIDYPETFNGNKLNGSDGLSLKSLVSDGGKLEDRDLFFEHQTSCAIISNGWKLVRAHQSKKWELINLAVDPFEMNNLYSEEPEIANRLEKRWNEWADKNNVTPLVDIPWTERINHYTKLNPDQDGID